MADPVFDESAPFEEVQEPRFDPQAPFDEYSPRVAEMASATRSVLDVANQAASVASYDPASARLETTTFRPDLVESVGTDEWGRPLDPRGRNPAQLNPSLTSSRTPESALSRAMTPLLPIRKAFTQGEQLSYLADKQPEGEAKKALTTAAGVVSGLEDVVGGAMEFMTSPVGISTMGLGAAPGALRSLASATFAADMISHAPEALKEFQVATTPEDKARALTKGIGNLALAGAASWHAIREAKYAAAGKAGDLARALDTAPLTMDAVRNTVPFQPVPSTSTPLTTAATQSVVEKGPSALNQSQAATLHESLPPQSVTSEGQVPAEVGGKGVQPYDEAGFGKAPPSGVAPEVKKESGVSTATKPLTATEEAVSKARSDLISAREEYDKIFRSEESRYKSILQGESTGAISGSSVFDSPIVQRQLRVRNKAENALRKAEKELEKELKQLAKVKKGPGASPAPSPATITGESGKGASVSAGAPPSAAAPIAQGEALAKPKSEQTLTPVPQQFMPSQKLKDILEGQEATTPPKGGLKTAVVEAPEGGAIFGIGGRRPPPPRVAGITPRGDLNWLRIPSAIRRVGRGLFTEGARAVLGRTNNQVGQELSQATRRHVDIEQELFGQHEAVLRRAINAIPRERLDPALTEASQYIQEVENGRPAPAVSPEAQSLLDAWFEVGRSTGDIARANNVQVFDPALGRHRPMGNVQNYVPRMYRMEVEAVLRDPQTDPRLFNDLAQAIATQRGITLEEGAAELRGIAGRFQSNDYMANLEMARGEQMPEIFYEYNLRNLAARYLPGFSERMAQIISYGQRLGPREAPQRMNLWDIARRESEDSYTQQWLNAAEDQATNFKPKSAIEQNARRAQAIASATLLSDPTTTVVRNLLSGVAATTEAYGVGRSVRQLREAARLSSRLGAREIGAVRDDLAAFINADQLGTSPADNLIREVNQRALGISGFTGSENFVRTHNAMTAASFAREAATALQTNPRSKIAREALAQFQRWNINPEAIVAENGNWRTGPETRQYIRTAVREMQGGYRFDQVPLWANSTAGRFFYQYGRWGVQRAQNIFQNVIRPAIGEDVTFRGQRMTHRDALPLIRAAAMTIGLGETFGAISSGLFGRDRRDSSLSEISQAASEDEKKAALMLGERLVNDMIMAGTLGIIGQPLDIAKAAKDQSRFKNPLDPPSAAGIKTIVGLAQKAIDQEGSLTKKDWLDAASGLVRGPKNISDVIRYHTGESLYMGQNDQRTLRNAALRWAKETGQDVPAKGGGEIRKSPMAPAYEAVNTALLAGNPDKAKKAVDDFLDSQPDRAKAKLALKASVRARQPFRAGNLTSETTQLQFMRWARENLSKADLDKIERVQDRYRITAAAAGVW